MKTFAKLALGGFMLAGAAAATSAPADAGVSVGVNFAVPGVAVGYYGNPCFRPYWYRPAYCGYPVYGEPIYFEGGWYRGPVYYRYFGGARYFWLRDRWMRDRDDFHRSWGASYRFHDGDHDGFRDWDGRYR